MFNGYLPFNRVETEKKKYAQDSTGGLVSPYLQDTTKSGYREWTGLDVCSNIINNDMILIEKEKQLITFKIEPATAPQTMKL